MTTTQMTHTEGRELAIARKRFRREVAMGRASWTDRLPVSPEMPSGPPVAPVRQTLKRTFGQGLGERHPIHRLPVTISDYEWWAAECAKAESRELERRAGEFEAAARIEAGCLM